MSCLKNIRCGKKVVIGIRDYKDCEQPTSNLWANDAPGVTLKSAAAIANDEQKSGYELLRQLTINAVTMTFDDFISQISGTFSYDYITEIRKIKYFDDTILGTLNKERGLILKRWRSDMAQIFIEEIHLKAHSTGTFTIKIIDGNHTENISVDIVADEEKTIEVNYLADAENVKILWDNSALEVYSGEINKTFTGCLACGHQNDNFYMNGWNGTTEEPRYFGIGVTAMVKCVEEKLICKALPKMSLVIWHRFQMLFWKEAAYSNRLNPIATFTKAHAEKAYKESKEEYEEAFFKFVPTIKQLLFQTKGDCLKCNSSIKYANTIP
jgi:hypothetical protein